jgi:hypothetical protein
MALDTALTLLSSSGLLGSVASIVKSVIDKSDLRKKWKDMEESTLPTFTRSIELRVGGVETALGAALRSLPEIERRASEATGKLEAAITRARQGSRASAGGDTHQMGAAMAELGSLRREIEALKVASDHNRLASALANQRLDQLEPRLGRFEDTYREDYNELLEKVSGITGEFKQAMRGKNAVRPSDG